MANCTSFLSCRECHTHFCVFCGIDGCLEIGSNATGCFPEQACADETSTSTTSTTATLTSTLSAMVRSTVANSSSLPNATSSADDEAVEQAHLMTGLMVLLGVVTVTYMATAAFVVWMHRRGKRVDAAYKQLPQEQDPDPDEDHDHDQRRDHTDN